MVAFTPLLAKKLKAVGIETCQDLIFYFPRRFDDFSRIVSIADLRSEMTATIQGRIDMISNRRSRRSHMIVTEALVSDESGSVKVIWFNQPFLTKNVREGDSVSLSGKTNTQFYDLQLVSPAYEKLGSDPSPIPSLVHTGRLTPVYSLPPSVTQKQFRQLVRTALDECGDMQEEWLPEEMLKAEEIPEIRTALEHIHFPDGEEQFASAQRRFKFEELFELQLHNAAMHQSLARQRASSIPFAEVQTKQFIASLPFVLTNEQKTVAWEVLRDITKETPMNRLLQGEVGAGKTVIAAIAMLNTVRAGYQCCLMAPTEVLAIQHYKTLYELFKGFDVSIALVTASVNMSSRGAVEGSRQFRQSRDSSPTVRNDVIVGTNALIQEKVTFKNLALAVVDEQHRFGVNQRKLLREKSSADAMPHLLSMTATPIPRSLALTVYGDLDISTLRALPKGRKKIITKIVPQAYREWTYDFIRTHVKHGRQAFVICPIIERSDTRGVRSVSDEFQALTTGPFQHERVAMLHGRMKPKEKEETMRRFRDHETDILVTTSVVEVGIDVPHATIMLVEGAERFGLAQLHQLRGRVGRAEHQSYCFLAPTDESKEEIARLKAVVSSNDGFALAEIDLQLRGEGDVYGIRQSGTPRLKVASLFDVELIQKARAYAAQYAPLLDSYPALKSRVDAFSADVHLE